MTIQVAAQATGKGNSICNCFTCQDATWAEIREEMTGAPEGAPESKPVEASE
jgi:hypothetical protein